MSFTKSSMLFKFICIILQLQYISFELYVICCFKELWDEAQTIEFVSVHNSCRNTELCFDERLSHCFLDVFYW